MGWAGGSGLMNEVIAAIQPRVTDAELRKSIYIPIIEAFDDEDWDTHGESLGIDPAFDDAMRVANPEYMEDWDAETEGMLGEPEEADDESDD